MALNAVSFQTAWVACVVGAAWGHPWVGPAVVLGALALHACLVHDPGRALGAALLIGLAGFLVDSVLGMLGILQFVDGMDSDWLCPPWLVALWMVFATTPEFSLQWLCGRPRLAAAFGAVAGPASYHVGASLGALRIGEPAVISLMTLACVWALVLPLMMEGVGTSMRAMAWRGGPG